jgi:electron transport complex protein RnfE
MSNNKLRLSDGLVRQNIVLMSATAIAPVAACATNFENALALSVGFSIIAFVSVILCRFVPKKIVYTIRVIIYAIIAGLSYIPAYLALSYFYGQAVVDNLGVYLPVLIVNPLILTKTETRFCLRPPHLMVLELAGYITGFNLVCLTVGIVRDVFTNGKIGIFEFSPGLVVPALSTTFGGFILIGVMAGLFRWLYNQSKERKAKVLEKERERQRLIEEVS